MRRPPIPSHSTVRPRTLRFVLSVLAAMAMPPLCRAAALFPDPIHRAGGTPLFLVTGDFDGDGRLDLAASNFLSDDVSVFLGDGDAALRQGFRAAAGAFPFGMAAGDFNADGRDDLAVANYGADDVSVLLSLGGGAFAPQTRIVTGATPFSLASGHFDADGRVDLAVVSQGTGEVALLRGAGDGTFTESGRLVAGISPSGIVVGDFDVDGSADLAVANESSRDLSVFRGRGDGTFEPESRYPTGFGPETIVVSDFNGDARLDLAAGNVVSRDITILLGNGFGGFSAGPLVPADVAPASLTAADLDGDGDSDLLIAGNDLFFSRPGARLIRGHGDGSFDAPIPFATADRVNAVATGDFDEDGRADLVWAREIGSFIGGDSDEIVLAAAAPAPRRSPILLPLPTESYPPTGLTLADLNADGLADLIASVPNEGADSPRGVYLYLSNGDGSFSPAPDLPAQDDPHAAAAGDIDRDGHVDLVVIALETGLAAGGTTIFLGRGDGTFLPGGRLDPGSEPRAIALADLDEDGSLDLLTARSGAGDDDDGELEVRLGRGDGTFDPGVRAGVGAGPRQILLADLNEDGALDLAVPNGTASSANPGVVSLLIGRGDGTFEPETRLLEASYGARLAVTDLNRDGHVDLVAVNVLVPADPYDEFGVVALLGDGTGQFAQSVPSLAGFGASGLAVGDFSPDGLPDVALFSYPDLLVGDGTGTGEFRLRSFHRPAQELSGPVISGDFDSDGRVDLAVSAGSGIVILMNDGPDPDRPPVARFDAAERTECTSPEATSVLLDATGSTSDRGIVSFEWFEDFGLPAQAPLGTGSILNASLRPGPHDVTLRVIDARGDSDFETRRLFVVDTRPPSISASASPSSLWPPNGAYSEVVVTVAADDACGLRPVVLVSVVSSEADDDAIRDADPGTSDFNVTLQADKTGSRRVYTLTYRAEDAAGNVTDATARVEVSRVKNRVR